MQHPKWALKHKRKGTELRLLNDTYYLYEDKSKWNPDKKSVGGLEKAPQMVLGVTEYGHVGQIRAQWYVGATHF